MEGFEVNINNNNNFFGLRTCSFRDDYIDVVRGRKRGILQRRAYMVLDGLGFTTFNPFAYNVPEL